MNLSLNVYSEGHIACIVALNYTQLTPLPLCLYKHFNAYKPFAVCIFPLLVCFMFILLFNKYLLNICFSPGTVSGAGNRSKSKEGIVSQ